MYTMRNSIFFKVSPSSHLSHTPGHFRIGNFAFPESVLFRIVLHFISFTQQARQKYAPLLPPRFNLRILPGIAVCFPHLSQSWFRACVFICVSSPSRKRKKGVFRIIYPLSYGDTISLPHTFLRPSPCAPSSWHPCGQSTST